jgi:hypothetical protein
VTVNTILDNPPMLNIKFRDGVIGAGAESYCSTDLFNTVFFHIFVNHLYIFLSDVVAVKKHVYLLTDLQYS